MSNPKVFFDITIGGSAAGRIVMEVRIAAPLRHRRNARHATVG